MSDGRRSNFNRTEVDTDKVVDLRQVYVIKAGDLNEKELLQDVYMGQYGQIKRIYIGGKAEAIHKGIYVTFEHEESAALAIMVDIIR